MPMPASDITISSVATKNCFSIPTSRSITGKTATEVWMCPKEFVLTRHLADVDVNDSDGASALNTRKIATQRAKFLLILIKVFSYNLKLRFLTSSTMWVSFRCLQQPAGAVCARSGCAAAVSELYGTCQPTSTIGRIRSAFSAILPATHVLC